MRTEVQTGKGESYMTREWRRPPLYSQRTPLTHSISLTDSCDGLDAWMRGFYRLRAILRYRPRLRPFRLRAEDRCQCDGGGRSADAIEICKHVLMSERRGSGSEDVRRIGGRVLNTSPPPQRLIIREAAEMSRLIIIIVICIVMICRVYAVAVASSVSHKSQWRNSRMTIFKLCTWINILLYILCNIVEVVRE